jgi:uncharacterized protein (DUF952 family)
MDLIYHVTTADEWKDAQSKGSYEADSLHSEGFIHCSTAMQVQGVLERYYSNVKNLVLLSIDPQKLKAPLKFEMAPSVNEEFPHVFGPINPDAVIAEELIS